MAQKAARVKTAAAIASWSKVHAVACLLCGALSVVLRRPEPLALGGALSLLAFFVLQRPRMPRFFGVGAANFVTLVRLLLVALCAVALPTWWSFGLVLVLDGLDGLLARRLKEETEFGAHFDMETDALLVAVLSLASVLHGAPLWVLTAGALRYVLVVARLIFTAETKEGRSRFGRAIFVFAVCALLLSLSEAPELLRTACLALAIAALLVSFAPSFLALRRASHA